jgi:hypothetical protein
MPKQKTVEKTRRAKREGKAATTQASEFVRDEIRTIRRGEHGARSPAQAKETTRKSAEYAYEVGQHQRKPKHQPRVARAVSGVMKKEPRGTVSREALSRHAKEAASRRKTSKRAAAAKKADAKRSVRPSSAVRKAQRTRKRRGA